MWSDGYARYNTDLSSIFSTENKLRLQIQIETVLAEVQEKLGMIPVGTSAAIQAAAPKVTVARVQEIEREIHHDLMAMVKALSEQAGVSGEYIHNTATSMDIQDTVLALQLLQARDILLAEGKKVMDAFDSKAIEYKDTPILGRTHGQFAVPTTIGFKFANYLYEFSLAFQNLMDIPLHLSKFSGAVGNYASSNRLDIESKVLKQLGLEPAKISTQVITRQIHARFLFATAQIAAIIERFAKEVRNLQRSEIQEFAEPRVKNQVGSSAMPHKRNPHKSERLNGLARVLRANVQVGLENIALEHERDITNSAPERLVIPENAVVLHYMLKQVYNIISHLDINLKAINRNIQRATVAKSEQILKSLIDKVGRQSGHELLREHVEDEDFRAAVLGDSRITDLISEEQLVQIFDDVSVGLAPKKVLQIHEFYLNQNFEHHNI